MLRLKKIKSAWREYAEGVKIEIQGLNSGAVNSIRDAGSRSRIEIALTKDGVGEPRRVIESDQKGEDEALVCEAIVGWEGVADADGNPMECTRANKLRLCRELDPADFGQLITWVHGQLREVDALVTQQAEASEGNSLPTPSGSPASTESTARPVKRPRRE